MKDQPTAFPTRKMMAVIISGLICGVIQTFMQTYAPEAQISELLAQVDLLVQTGVMVLAGYMTRERA